MTGIRFYLDGDRVGPMFKRATTRQAERVRQASRRTAEEAASQILELGRADIASAPGNWGARWPAGLHADISEGGGNIRVEVWHDVPYFRVFEDGAVIHGKPLLWIPLDFAEDAKGKNARDYPGVLFRVDRKSGQAPLLLAPGKPAQPKYHGQESVTIPKKFHITEIARRVAQSLGRTYREVFNK